MHDDMPGGVPQGPAEPAEGRLILRHFDTALSIRDLLRSTLDRLLDELVARQETMGVVGVTVIQATGETEKVWGGRTVLLALDLDPHECEGCERCDGSSE